MKKNSRPTRKILQEFREISARRRIECREKYRLKIDHLTKKYRRSKEEILKKIPEDMQEFEELRIFDPDQYSDIEEESHEIKIIGDVELTEKELKKNYFHSSFFA